MNEITAIIIYSIYPYYFIDNDMKSDNEKIKEYIIQLVTIEEIRSVRDELLDAMRTDSYRF